MVVGVGEVWACGWCVSAAGFDTALQLSPQLYILLADQIIQPNHPADPSRTGAGGTHKTKTNKEEENEKRQEGRSARTQKGWGETNARY